MTSITSKPTTKRKKRVKKPLPPQPDASGWYDIHYAASEGDVPTWLKRVIEKDKGETVNLVTKNDRACTPLIITAEYDYTEAMALLLDCKADIDKTDRWGCTALMSAIEEEHPAAVRMLLERGANREIRITSGDDKGMTALDLARAKGDSGDNGDIREIITMLEAKPAPEAPPAPFPLLPSATHHKVSNLAE